jgi:tripeptidyl-peptidase-2
MVDLSCRRFHGSNFWGNRPCRSLLSSSFGDTSTRSLLPNNARQQSRRFSTSPSSTRVARFVSCRSSPTFEDTMAEPVLESEIDWSAAVPKQEIQARSFLEQNPTYDGREVVIAILDTGVDPGAAGLQLTPSGEKKIVDVVDCTGCGDVDVSTIREGVEEGGVIKGVYGDALRVNPDWKNPSGKWHVGSKRIYELYPAGLRERMKSERKKKLLIEHQRLVAAATLEAFELSEGIAGVGEGENVSEVEKKQKEKTLEELKGRKDLLDNLLKNYDGGAGPSIECVVWHDGEKWLAAIDTQKLFRFYSTMDNCEEKGLLADFEPLTNYSDCLRYGTFTPLDACNFAVNVYDQGKTLSIVVDAGSHGTHVAGIAAGFFPNDEAMNGIAPGAKIVSCKIGDTRLGSMETMTGLTRAVIAILKNRCDLVNMSYGEASSAPNAGRFVRLAEELVHKHNVIYVASAGNAGPALSTVGAPGGTSDAIMSIGAYVTPDLAKTGHSVRHPIEADGAQYTWSSRGPTVDGDKGVCVSAPGGAVTSVPQWTTQKKQLMNGTSMSSPCACGGLALVVSAMKANKMQVTPSLVRRAAENSAKFPQGRESGASALTYGSGLLQVASCWHYLRENRETELVRLLPDLRFSTMVRRTDGNYKGRGVYLRDAADSSKNRTFAVFVKPELHEDADVVGSKVEVDLKLHLKSTAEWLVGPSSLLLHHNGRQFEMDVNCERLDYGLHYAEIQAFCSSTPGAGKLFSIPVTVIKPRILGEGPGRLDESMNGSTTISWSDKSFVPGIEDREYVMVPHSATWAELVIRPTEISTSMGAMIRATCIQPYTRYSDTEYRSYVSLADGGEHSATFPVVGGSTMELTIAQFWSSFGNNKLSIDVTFHGCQIQPGRGQSFTFNESCLPVKGIVHAPIRSELLKPTCKLDALSSFYRPTKSKMVVSSDARNELPGSRTVHELVLTYENISVEESSSITCKIEAINNYVYDGELSGQLTIVRDNNGKIIGVGDIYPEKLKVKKGEYSITVCLRHEDPIFLKKFEQQVLQVERKLESNISLPIYGNYSNAIQAKDELKKMTLAPGEQAAIFIGMPSELPKDAGKGSVLTGTLACAATSSNKQAPGGSPVTFVCSPPKKKESENDDLKSSCQEPSLEDRLRDAKVDILKKIGNDAFEDYKDCLMKEYPTHLPILQEELKRAEKADDAERQRRVSDQIIRSIDTDQLAIYMGKKRTKTRKNLSKKIWPRRKMP